MSRPCYTKEARLQCLEEGEGCSGILGERKRKCVGLEQYHAHKALGDQSVPLATHT